MFQATAKAKALEGTTWGEHTPRQGHQLGHTQATTASGATGTQEAGVCAVGQGRGENHRGEREAEVTAPEHRGEGKCCQQEGYCVATRVPFVLIKKDRRSEPQLSHAKKC